MPLNESSIFMENTMLSYMSWARIGPTSINAHVCQLRTIRKCHSE